MSHEIRNRFHIAYGLTDMVLRKEEREREGGERELMKPFQPSTKKNVDTPQTKVHPQQQLPYICHLLLQQTSKHYAICYMS